MRKKPYTSRYTFYVDSNGNEYLNEVLVCNFPVFGKGFEADDNKEDEKRRNKGQDYIISENKARAVRRARRQIVDYINCNSDLDCFITCTLNGEDFARDDKHMFVKKLNVWLCNMVQRNNLKYVIVPEFHKNGAIHFHGLCNALALQLLDSGTVIRPDKGKPVKLSTALRQGYNSTQLKTVYNINNWKYGFSTAIMTDENRKAIATYISKYVSKDFDTGSVGGRYYYHSSNLNKPRYVYEDLIFDDLKEYIASGEFTEYEFSVENFCSFKGVKKL